MSFKCETPEDFPKELFRTFLQTSPEQQALIRRYLESDSGTQSVVRSMFAVLDSAYVTEEDRCRAVAAIADALDLGPQKVGGAGACNPVEPPDYQAATFSQRLRNILEQKNITQEELAERMGCTQSAISKMLVRNARPHKKTIFKVAAALDVPPTDLWPDLEVAAILDSTADFPQERDLTKAQAAALEAAITRPPAQVPARDLPSRRK